MNTLAIILPIEFFCRIEHAGQASLIYQQYIKSDVKLSKAIWLKSSPTSGYPAPVDHSSFNKKNRQYPSLMQNGLHYSWVGSTYDTKCLVSFNPSIVETSIPLATEEEIIFMHENVSLERAEITKLYEEKNMEIKPRVWKAFRMSEGNDTSIEIRQWLFLGEVCNLFYGSAYRHPAIITSQRISKIKKVAEESGLFTMQKDRFTIATEHLVNLKNLLDRLGEL
jgi:hypothetical protein